MKLSSTFACKFNSKLVLYLFDILTSVPPTPPELRSEVLSTPLNRQLVHTVSSDISPDCSHRETACFVCGERVIIFILVTYSVGFISGHCHGAIVAAPAPLPILRGNWELTGYWPAYFYVEPGNWLASFMRQVSADLLTWRRNWPSYYYEYNSYEAWVLSSPYNLHRTRALTLLT